MSFYLALHTGKDYDSESYDEAAGNLLNLFTSIVSDRAALASLTHDSPITGASTEIEVMMEENELVAKAVLDLQCEEKVKFDKGRFTKLVRAHASTAWPQMKIVKKAVAEPQ